MPISYRSPPGGTSTEIQVRALTGVHYGVPGTSWNGTTLTLPGSTFSASAVTVDGVLRFSGATADYPMLKRTATQISCKLGDDSAYAPFNASVVYCSVNIQVGTAGIFRTSGDGYYTGGNFGLGLSTGISARLHVVSVTSPQFILGYDGTTNQTTFATSATGNLTVTPSGGTVSITGKVEASSTTYPVASFTRSLSSPSAILYGAALLKLTATSPIAGYGVATFFQINNASGSAKYAGMFGCALSSITAGAEIGEMVFAASWQNADPGAKRHLVITATGADTGDVSVPNGRLLLPDSGAITLGTGNDATITYNGTNLVINPKVVGSGYLSVLGAIYTPGYLTNRPALYYGKYTGPGAPKPTPVERGGVLGFSMPIYAGDDEELFFRDHVPGRWNGASDITVEAKCYIDTANTAGEKFQFQLSWYNSSFSGVTIAATTTDVKTETTIVSGTQYAAYTVSFTVDWDVVTPDIAAGDLLSMRLRRIAVEAGGDECEGEIVVADITVKYQVDKVYKAA